MATEVVMPQMGESIAEGTITKWLKNVGDHVDRDEPLFEISTDKVDAEIPSPAAGTLTEIKHQEGETVEVNTVVAVLDGDGAQPAAAPPATTEQPPPETEALRPRTSPGAAMRKVRRLPVSEQMNSLARPSHNTKIPRALWPSWNNVLPRGYKATVFRESNASNASAGRSQKSRSGRRTQSKQLGCSAVSMLL